MNNVIVIINVGDIPAAVAVSKNLSDYVVYIFDPVLEDRVAASGLKNIRFFLWRNCPSYYKLDAEAHASAFALEAELDRAVRPLLPDVSILGWQHLNMYYLLMMLRWYGALWEARGEQFQNFRVHVFVCDNPAEYYFNSFIPSHLLLWYLKAHEIEFSGYTYGGDPVVDSRVPNLSASDCGDFAGSLLLHLPTCMYDIGYFNAEILAANKMLVNIDAKHFNMPVAAHKTIELIDVQEVFSMLDQATRTRIDAVVQRLEGAMGAFFASQIVVPSYRQRQVQNIARLYRCQLVTYYALNRHFDAAKPAKLLLSDHDAGFHGPLISFAQKHSLPVMLLPHSKTSGDVEFGYRNVVCVTHPMQAQDILDGNRKLLLNLRVSYPEDFSSSSHFSGDIATISLMLNSLSLNGIYTVDPAVYLRGIRRLVSWCSNNNIRLKIRCKPSYSIISMLVRELGLDAETLLQQANESMEAHASGCDLCLMYDVPTSGVLHFLKNSIPILNPVVGRLTNAQMAMVHPEVVAPESVDAILLRLDGFKSDPVKLFAFRNTQFCNYLAQFKSVRPLRSYL